MTTRMRWIHPFVAALLLAASPLLAAPQGDAKLQLKAAFEPATAKPGDTVLLVLTATVEPGFHAYGTLEPTNIPVSLDQTKLQLGGLQTAGKASIPPGNRHAVFGIESFPLPNEFRVTQKLKVPQGVKAGEVTVQGELGYQVCDENMCLPPDTAAFTARLKVEGGPAPAPEPPAEPPGKLQLKAAFVPATAKAGETVELVLTATVDPGYHAYGTLETTNVPVAFAAKKQQFGGLVADGKPSIPPGDKHEVFGIEQYPLPQVFEVRQKLKVPQDAKAGAIAVSGVLDYQVCDENSCDPPGEASYRATLQVTGGAGGPEPGKQPGKQPVEQPVQQPEPAGEPGKVMVTASFSPAVARAGEKVTLVLTAVTEPGWHAYGTRDPQAVQLDVGKLQLGPLQPAGAAEIPPGEPHENEFLGTQYPLPPEFTIRLPLAVPAGTADGEIEVRGGLDYTVCDENSCDPAAVAPFSAKLTVGRGGAARNGGGNPSMVGPQPGNGGGDAIRVLQPKYADITGQDDLQGSLWSLILICIGGGIVALVMPCTYPMIPITFSFFTKQADARGGRVLSLALAYGLGIVLIFVVTGVAIGEVIVPFAQHWITNLVIGGAFVLFAASLFGFVTLQPPGWLTNAAGRAGATGGLLGVFLMGATLVVTSFTCTAPIVGSLLAGVASAGRGRVALGMAVFGLTMAAPFVVLALLPGRVKALPRSGEWMNTLKVSLGFIELAAALKFLSNVDVGLGLQVYPREVFLISWAFVFTLLALFLFGLFRYRNEPVVGSSGLRNGFGIASMAFAFYCLFGTMGFALDPIMTAFEPPYRLRAIEEHSIVKDDYEAALALARKEHKLVLVNFTGFT